MASVWLIVCPTFPSGLIDRVDGVRDLDRMASVPPANTRLGLLAARSLASRVDIGLTDSARRGGLRERRVGRVPEATQ